MYKYIDLLIGYAIEKELIEEEDKRYIRNKLLDKLNLDEYVAQEFDGSTEFSLSEILNFLTDYACDKGLIDDTQSSRDLFDTSLMGELTLRPSQISTLFMNIYHKSAKEATDFFYKFCLDVNYIRKDRMEKDIKWVTGTEYGDLDISINLAKPEKDPKDIAAARNKPPSGYPACMLCAENEGYAGRIDYPARQNHRIIPIKICEEPWGFQYSPYVYYNEHCIVLNQKHIPMIIDKSAFEKLISFIKQFPHYFVGSNADLPIVGGSILSHEHFQGGRYVFAMERAPVEKKFKIDGFESAKVGIVKWPLSVIRISHKNPNVVVDLADRILETWRGYNDESAGIYAMTNGVPHNTITPIARMRDGEYEFDLALRNNRTSAEYPMGIFHPHSEVHNIKKENIGLIEVMGLAILPARLKTELELVKKALLSKEDMRSIEETSKHADWTENWIQKYDEINEDNIDSIIRDEVGNTFKTVLEHSGVFKRTEKGQESFEKFIRSL